LARGKRAARKRDAASRKHGNRNGSGTGVVMTGADASATRETILVRAADAKARVADADKSGVGDEWHWLKVTISDGILLGGPKFATWFIVVRSLV
jgi:hypothetical protein